MHAIEPRRAARRRAASLGSTSLLALASVLLLGACAASPRPNSPELRPRAPLRLWLGGDVHVGSTTPRALLEGIPLLARAEGVVNLEGPISKRRTTRQPDGRWLLFNAPSVAPMLARAGVTAATAANNHARDDGIDGVVRTAKTLSKAGLQASSSRAHVAWLAGGGAMVVAVDLSDALPAGLGSFLRHVRGPTPLQIVSFHVRAPPSYLPTARLRRAVDIAIAARANIVVAHGSHEIARVERRGAAVVAWGLGNLLFNCRCTHAREGLVLYVEGQLRRPRVAVVPIDVGLDGKPARPSADAEGVFALLRGLGSTQLDVQGALGWLR